MYPLTFQVVTWLGPAESEAAGAPSPVRMRGSGGGGVQNAPEETILYSLVRGRAELILFGGIQASFFLIYIYMKVCQTFFINLC